MAYELYLRIYNRAGVLKLSYVPVIWARYSDAVNQEDPVVFMLNAESDAAQQIAEFDLVEVMIRNKELLLMASDGGFVSAYMGIVRDWDFSTDDNGIDFIEFKAPGINHILSWRSILYYANQLNLSRFDEEAAETILKTLVRYNCTAYATTGNGRQRNGDLSPGMGIDLTIGYDGAGGNVISATFKGGNLLSSLQKIADQAGGDFAVTWLGDNDFLFEFYPGQLGDDLSSGMDRVLFSRDNATLKNPRLKRSGARATVAVSAGEGQEDEREISLVYGYDYASDYDIEIFVDARNEKTAEGRITRGGIKLDERRIREELTFNTLQTANQFYSPIAITGRKTYRAGDLVLAVFGTEEIRKIEAVQVYWKVPGNEDPFTVDIKTREVILYGS